MMIIIPFLTFVNMSKWKQNQEKESFKDDKEGKRFHGARRFQSAPTSFGQSLATKWYQNC